MVFKLIYLRLQRTFSFLFAFALVISLQQPVSFASVSEQSETLIGATEPLRIVSLSPHLTELVFALQQEHRLVAVSDYSNYPLPQGCIDKSCNTTLPSVASYQGANIADIIRLKPTIILAWEGGNKAQDIARLEQLGYRIFRSAPNNIQTLMDEVSQLGQALNAVSASKDIVAEMRQQVADIQSQFVARRASALYYMNEQPLSGIGSDIWLNSLLSLCGITNIYAELPTPYAQFSLADIIRKKPAVVIAASHKPYEISESYWAAHAAVFSPKLVQVNPDALHRFTPRVLPELAKLCKKVHF